MKFRKIKRNLDNNNKTNDKSFYKKQLKKILISIIIIAIIVVIKKLNNGVSNDAIKFIDEAINYNFNIKENASRIINYTQELTGNDSMEIEPVFDEGEYRVFDNKGFESPVTGTLYQNFGENHKGNNVTTFNNGIDIIANDSKVIAISDGIVNEIGVDKTYGQYIKINHGQIEAFYGGLETIDVKKNAKVKKGEKIASLGLLAQGKKKFHFEIWKDNLPLNPLKVITYKKKVNE